MRGLLTLLGGALVTFAILGWYFNWYEFNRTKTADGKERIELEFDTKKINEDAQKGINRVDKAIHSSSPK